MAGLECEYDSEAVIRSHHPAPLEKPDTPEMYRHHFRLLRDGLTPVDERGGHPQGMPAYNDFVHGVTSALDHVRKSHAGNVLIVEQWRAHLDRCGAHLRHHRDHHRAEPAHPQQLGHGAGLHPKRHMLVTYNTLPHLDDAAYADWVTYSSALSPRRRLCNEG